MTTHDTMLAVEARTWMLAGWWRRVLASVVDLVILAAAVSLLGTVAATDSGGRSLLALIASALYVVGCIGGPGRTAGCFVAGVRVIADDGRLRVGTGVALLRWVGQVVLALTVVGGLLDVLWPLRDPQYRTLHDRLAATVVVRAPSW